MKDRLVHEDIIAEGVTPLSLAGAGMILDRQEGVKVEVGEVGSAEETMAGPGVGSGITTGGVKVRRKVTEEDREDPVAIQANTEAIVQVSIARQIEATSGTSPIAEDHIYP